MTKALTRVVVLLAMLLAITPPVAAQQPRDPLETMRQIQALVWRHGPADADIGGLASIKVPKGLSFLGGALVGLALTGVLAPRGLQPLIRWLAQWT